MVLKSQVEWALHCAAVLAGLPEGRYLATKDLAEFHGVPKEYLSKALQGLSAAGIVAMQLGPRGGYRLARDPGQISFLDIVEAVEGGRSTFSCSEIRKRAPCKAAKQRDARPCAIARVMWEADEAWRGHLRATTLSSLLVTLAGDLSTELREQAAAWIGERI